MIKKISTSTQQSLVQDYLKFKNQKDSLDQKIADLESRILVFSKKNKLHRLKTATHYLYVIQKTKTVFPKKSSPQRQLLEKLVESSSDHDKYLDLDIVSLATAYDKKKLSKTLQNNLKPLAQKKPFTKISLFSLSK